MASIFSSMIGRTKAYEPSPRWSHYAAPVGGRCLLWGGRVPDFSASGRKKLASTVEIFDPYLEVWEQQATSGVSPHGLCAGVGVSLLGQLYSFGGMDGASYYNSLHTLDPTSLEWKELRVLNQADGPMRKYGCGMVSYNGDRLALFGGYGIPTGPTPPGATFTKDTRYTGGWGWSNELHIFNINEGKWSIPTTTGPRPPPCSHFTFTAVSDHLAVLFGGRQPGGRVSDCYVVNFKTMEWTKLERAEGAPWPAERSSHAACCLNYGQDHPQVLVTGGRDKNGNTINDVWILDVQSGRWRELTLPEGAQPRMFHTVTAFSLGPGRTQVTMFGGCPKWEDRKSLDALPKLAETTVLEFESVETPSGGGPPTREWVLAGVAGKSQLGSNQRMKEKVANMCREIEAGRQALQEARSQQGLDRRVQDAEARAQDLRIRLETAQDAYQESQQSLQESRQSLQVSQAEKRDLQVQLEAAQDAYQECQQSLQESQQSLQESQQSLQESQQSLQTSQAEANTRTQDLQRRVQDAECRAEEAERRWVVQRDEINLTDRELGRGGWAVVRVAEFRGVRCAAKCMYEQIVSNYNRHLVIREMNMASRVRHPNLLQFIGATLRGELIILTELMPTSVRQELENERPFSQNQITSISLDVARALNYLHLMQPSPIIHRDISSANVLLEPGPSNSWRAKVSDYGSVNLLERLSTTAPGNPTYAAPEAGNPAFQSPKMDIFSFGILLVEMCSTHFPEVADRERFIRSIQQPRMVALIRRCLADDRNARPSASDTITELSEPHDN